MRINPVQTSQQKFTSAHFDPSVSKANEIITMGMNIAMTAPRGEKMSALEKAALKREIYISVPTSDTVLLEVKKKGKVLLSEELSSKKYNDGIKMGETLRNRLSLIETKLNELAQVLVAQM